VNEELERLKEMYSERNIDKSPSVVRSGVSKSVICSKCGALINLAQKFCTNCGQINIRDVTIGI